MTYQDLQTEISHYIKGIEHKNIALHEKAEEYLELAIKKADAENAYSIASAQEMARLDLAGTKTTLVPTLAKGTKTVADLKRDFDIAKGVLKACEISMENIRTAIDSYRSILSTKKTELDKLQG